MSQVKATIHEQVAGRSGVGLESQLVEANVGGTVQGQSELVMQAGRLARTQTRMYACSDLRASLGNLARSHLKKKG